MPTVHVVEKCEHISEIAQRFGFASFRTIWDHPENADLKSRRKNPHILERGDRLFIPDRGERIEDRSTEKRHRFVAKAESIELRVKVLDVNGEAVAGPCFLKISSAPNLMRESEGLFTSAEPIERDAKTAAMDFPEDKDDREVTLKIGCLQPIDTPGGQRDRLNNLGYFAGFAEVSDAEIVANKQFVWAVEEFQCDHGIKPQKPVCDEQTQDALEKAHGC